jgi:CheY-like chemotaxis protein
MAQRQLKVLLADDVKLELEIEKTFFQRSGFVVVTAADGPKALAIALTQKPDLVILDQVMPGLNGTDVCKLLKARPETAKIPVVITSSVSSPEIREVCSQAGADEVVSKADGREALLETAARILNVHQRRTTRITVFFSSPEVVGGKESLGKGVELSEGVIGLETTKRYEPGAFLQLRFMLQGERAEHSAGARVLRVVERPDASFLHTLEFTDLTVPDRRRLNEYLDRALGAR